jgi:hypothetical protein
MLKSITAVMAAAGCAFALISSAPMLGLDMIAMRAPQHVDFMASAENKADSDAMMVAIREQANAALATLQTAAAKHP